MLGGTQQHSNYVFSIGSWCLNLPQIMNETDLPNNTDGNAKLKLQVVASFPCYRGNMSGTVFAD